MFSFVIQVRLPTAVVMVVKQSVKTDGPLVFSMWFSVNRAYTLGLVMELSSFWPSSVDLRFLISTTMVVYTSYLASVQTEHQSPYYYYIIILIFKLFRTVCYSSLFFSFILSFLLSFLPSFLPTYLPLPSSFLTKRLRQRLSLSQQLHSPDSTEVVYPCWQYSRCYYM